MLNASQSDVVLPLRQQQFRALIVLGRVSNLPTVWSNCLAAWLIAGGGSWGRLAIVAAAGSFLYLGGMFLNDAFDVGFDLRYRPERPIPSGRIGSGTVWAIGLAWLVIGWLAAASQGGRSCVVGTILLLAIVCYDWCHKRFRFAPWLMAACRFLVYLLAATASGPRAADSVVIPGLFVAAYILGLSYIARVESAPGWVGSWPIVLLFASVILSLARNWASGAAAWIAAAALGTWLCWCLGRRDWPARSFWKNGVAGLLAGIPLLDWLNAAPYAPTAGTLFCGLFLLALALQRWAPAT